ncbi:hypothetical protein B0H67DRAFT_638190 [Lasiosphaeris hirsuta]|uniref:Uncharacterized protein n=1 Tax=Lasiosphaeris hirsuta TaxID=260670 RepID=A0AA40E799_9PEZI|nr:hypothetical protein B0H67DRAFT_638190 [Lasiosphaeris hirsuta]
MASIGRSWEILRRNVPLSPGSKTTRIVDFFTKQDGGHGAFRDPASVNFAGTYTHPDNSTATIKLLPDESGLFVSEMHSGWADFIALMATI